MDLRELSEHRLGIGIGLAVVILVVWYVGSYRPRQVQAATLNERIELLASERDRIARQIAEEQRLRQTERFVPGRVTPALAGALSPIERLNHFLESITTPANDLELSYFSVTPLSPRTGPGFQEIPFSISVTGTFAALADFLYQLEYGRSFVVREPALTRIGPGTVRAEFQLAALVLTEPLPEPPAEPDDPGRPTSLELARDPFTQPPARLATGPDGRRYFLSVPAGLHLSGIMETGGRRVAIINREPYRVGMTIDHKTITRIDERGVELTDAVRTYFLEMEQPPPSGRAAEASRR